MSNSYVQSHIPPQHGGSPQVTMDQWYDRNFTSPGRDLQTPQPKNIDEWYSKNFVSSTRTRDQHSRNKQPRLGEAVLPGFLGNSSVNPHDFTLPPGQHRPVGPSAPSPRQIHQAPSPQPQHYAQSPQPQMWTEPQNHYVAPSPYPVVPAVEPIPDPNHRIGRTKSRTHLSSQKPVEATRSDSRFLDTLPINLNVPPLPPLPAHGRISKSKSRLELSNSYSTAQKSRRKSNPHNVDEWFDQNIANPKKSSYQPPPGMKLPQYPIRHNLGTRGQRGVKVSTILSKGVFDTCTTKIFDIMECDGHPKLWVKLPGTLENQLMDDPPTVGKSTTVGQYLAKVVAKVLKMRHGQKDPNAMHAIWLEVSVHQCIVFFETI